MNGQAIESNKQSFNWGRLAAIDPARVAAAAMPAEAKPDSQRLSQSLDEMIERRVKFLTDYQDAAYAKRYTDLVAQVRAAEAKAMPGITELTEAVARYYFKLLAIKDEYEVARLYAESDFTQARRRAVRRRLQADVPPGAAGVQQARPHHRRAEEVGLRSVDDEGVRRAGQACAASAAPASISSAARRSARWNVR